jgi:MFS transporter, SP family, general alpha glucoside:H+ symporter
MATPKQDVVEAEVAENRNTTDDAPPIKGCGPVMRSKEDELTVWQSAVRHRVVGCIAMTASFCAALDGYRT